MRPEDVFGLSFHWCLTMRFRREPEHLSALSPHARAFFQDFIDAYGDQIRGKEEELDQTECTPHTQRAHIWECSAAN